jgi:hypothetical protein
VSDVRIAKEDLFIGRVRAHRKGDEVPADNVERNGWQEQVTSPSTRAAAKAKAGDDG